MVLPTGFVVKRITNITENGIKAMVEVLDIAFKGDSYGQVLDGGEGLVDLIFRSSIGSALVGGEVHVAAVPASNELSVVVNDGRGALGKGGELEGMQIVGVALWFGPGQVLNSTAEQRAAGWDAFMGRASERLRVWYADHFIPRVSGAAEAAYGAAYPNETWDLQLFAVHPEWQRRGIAKAMIGFTEAKAKVTGARMTVETVTNVDVLIYKKMGYEMKGQVKLEALAVPEGCVLKFMTKDV